MKKDVNNIKLVFILLSVIVVIFSLSGNIISSNKGSVSLIHFESFYVYVIAIVFAIYGILNGKNSNGFILSALVTYFWTYYLVDEMVKTVTDMKLVIQPSLYIYLGSSVFLIISLLFNNKSDKKEKVLQDEKGTNNVSSNLQNDEDFDESNFLFTNYISGFKEIPYNTTILLVNDTKSSSLNLVYKLNTNQTIQIPFSKLGNVSYINRVRVSNNSKKVEDNNTKSMLLSAAMFGGSPLLQLAGNYGMNNLFDSISNNYEKVNFNAYFEITIEAMINNELKKLVFTSDVDPNEFVDKLLFQISNKNKSV